MEHSALSLLPALTAIFLAVITRKVIPSLFIGIWIGATQLCGWNPVLGFFKLFEGFIIPALGSRWNATVIMYGAAFGGLIALIQRTGGAGALGDFFSRKARSSKYAQFYTTLFGVLIFFDDYFNCLTVGAIMRPICDRFRVAREKLAFIIDSTGAPICLLVPVSTWVAYVMGLIGKELEAGSSISPYMLYLKTIPLNFYSIAAIAGAFVFSLTALSFGPMRKAEERAEKTGKVLRDGAIPQVSSEITEVKVSETIKPVMSSILVPIGVMLLVLPLMFLYTGDYFNQDKNVSFVQAIGDSKGALSILISSLAAGFTALFLAKIRGYFDLSTGMDYYISGMKGMFVTYIILILAWAIGSVTKELGTARYVGNVILGSMSPALIPAFIFLLGAIISFTTGTSYGTFAILVPIALPVSISMNIPVEYCLSAVLSGGIFGDHCSPLSDTTILSSAGAACDHMDHVITQIPYALLYAVSAASGFLTVGFTGSTLAGFAVCALVLTVLMLAGGKKSV